MLAGFNTNHHCAALQVSGFLQTVPSSFTTTFMPCRNAECINIPSQISFISEPIMCFMPLRSLHCEEASSKFFFLFLFSSYRLEKSVPEVKMILNQIKMIKKYSKKKKKEMLDCRSIDLAIFLHKYI